VIIVSGLLAGGGGRIPAARGSRLIRYSVGDPMTRIYPATGDISSSRACSRPCDFDAIMWQDARAAPMRLSEPTLANRGVILVSRAGCSAGRQSVDNTGGRRPGPRAHGRGPRGTT
jgi:hypothetical protein